MISAKLCTYSLATCAKPKHDRTPSNVVGLAKLLIVDTKVGSGARPSFDIICPNIR